MSFLNTFVGMTHSLDVEQANPAGGTIYNIWATAIVNTTLDNGTAVGIPWLYYGSENPTTYPTTFQIYDDLSYKHP